MSSNETQWGPFEGADQDYGSAAGWNPDKEMLAKMIAESKKQEPRAWAERPEMFHVQTVREYIECGVRQGPMKQLFGPLWLEGELAVLYSQPGLGKSVLAMQIAECLARGVALEPFAGGRPAAPHGDGARRVLYLDFELTPQQLSHRYTPAGENGYAIENAYSFSPELRHATHCWNGRLLDGYDDFTDMILEAIREDVHEHRADVLIVDNLSFLSRGSTTNAIAAFRLMLQLQELKKLSPISVLAVAHTPKHVDHRPLSGDDLQGSVDLAKVADSMFVLGGSARHRDLRYLKQVKARTGLLEHDADNVLIYRLAKFDFATVLGSDAEAVHGDNFLGLDFLGFEPEHRHLTGRSRTAAREPRNGRRPDRLLVDYARTLAKQGLSAAAIAERLGVGRTTAYRYAHAPGGAV